MKRGFEASTQRWYDALVRLTDLDVHLLTGGKAPGAVTIPNLSRLHPLIEPLSHLPFLPEKNRFELTYGIEQITFFPGLLIELRRLRPDVVWVKDVPLAHMLQSVSRLKGLEYRVIFANGGALRPASYRAFDFVQQLHPGAMEEALEAGIPASRMALLSNCIDVESIIDTEAGDSRTRAGAGPEDCLIVCSAAFNRYHKRIDYLIEEVASLADERVKLLVCGAEDADSQGLKSLGRRLLGDRVRFLTLPPGEAISMISCADIFVLPSLYEGLGNVLIEAALLSVPIICHPHPGGRFIVEDSFFLNDLSQPGALAGRIRELQRDHLGSAALRARTMALRDRVAEKFSDRNLVRGFVDMIETGSPGAMRKLLILAVGLILLLAGSPVSAEVEYKVSPEEAAALEFPVVLWRDESRPVRGIVLAVHGFTLCADSFDATARHLAGKGLPVYAFDLSGFGRWLSESDKFGGDKNINYESSKSYLIDSLRFLRKQYPDYPLILLGESMGANLAVWACVEEPSLVDGAILSALCYKQRFHPRLRWFPDVVRGMVHPKSPLSLTPYVCQDVSHDQGVIDDYVNDPKIRHSASPTKLVKATVTNRRSLEDVAGLPEHLPVLILSGEKDRLFKTESVPHLVKKMGSSDVDFRVIPGWGHLILEQQSLDDSVARIIDDWIDSRLPRLSRSGGGASEPLTVSRD